MQNSEYWRMRFGQLEEAQNRKGAEACLEIERQYRRAQREIEGKINTWYQRLAGNNRVSMAEARKLLSGNDLKEFKWDVWEYIKHGEENGLEGRWAKELENASARFHISRLEALKLQVQQSLEVMFGNQLDSVDAAMKRIYLDGYYHTAYELQKGIGIGWDIAGLDQRKIEKVISRPWAVDGKNFSERIWGNKQKLIAEIRNELTQNIMLGEKPQKAIDNIAKKMNTSKSNAGRLVMTEEAYFSSVAQKDCFNDLDVEEYEVVATLDSHTSEICRSLDGKVYPMKDFEPGVTAPPFHVRCRSTTVPHFDDNFGRVGERAARGEDGKTYYVPADMTYEEWKKTFVDSNKKSTVQADASGTPEYDNPKILERLDISDKNVVLSKLEEHEKEIADSPIENAIVISKDGTVTQCFGTLNGVYPDVDLGEQLKGAYVTHNHPAGSANEYSFSNADIKIFINNELEVLRGIDEKYIYELTRNAQLLDEHVSLEELMLSDGDFARHENVIDIVKQYGIGYRRWKR